MAEEKKKIESEARKVSGPYYVVGTWTCNKDPPRIQFVSQDRAEVVKYLEGIECTDFDEEDKDVPFDHFSARSAKTSSPQPAVRQFQL